MIYAHDYCAAASGCEVDPDAPPCSAICEICWQPGGALVLVRGVSRLQGGGSRPRLLLLFRALFRTFLGDYLKLSEPDTAVHLLPEQARFPVVDMSDWTDEERDDIGLVAEIPTRDGGALTVLIQPEPEPRGPAETARRFGRWFLALEVRLTRPVLLSVVYLRGGRPGPNLESVAAGTIFGLEVVRIFYTAFGLSEARANHYLERPEPLAWALAALMKPVRREPAEHRKACLARIAGADRLTPEQRALLVACVAAAAPGPEEEGPS